jgi:hypothetical protein
MPVALPLRTSMAVAFPGVGVTYWLSLDWNARKSCKVVAPRDTAAVSVCSQSLLRTWQPPFAES